MNDTLFTVPCRTLPRYDVVVAGGGVAGCAAAVSAARNGARVLLAESGGEPGGDITKGFVPQMLDPLGKGGYFAEACAYLNKGGHTAARRGPRFDEQGRRIPGTLLEPLYLECFFDETLRDAGVETAYYTMVSGVEKTDGTLTRVLLCSEAGNFAAEASVFIDCTGNGQLAGMCGCASDFGHPETGEPQAASMGMMVTGLPADTRQTDSEEEKFELKRRFEAAGVRVSSNQASLVRAATPGCWLLGFHFEYGIQPDDIFAMSRGTANGRLELTSVTEKLRSIPGWEELSVVQMSSHLGIREGRRIRGKYCVTVDDIVSGARFDDGICLVRFGVDVHATAKDDSEDYGKERRVHPYHIPYRSLVPEDCGGLLLAGRCISGDFYAHSSYRVAADCIAMGEAAGYAAALCVKEGTSPAQVDGTRVSAYMAKQGYEL